jgi:hypothetical protein
LQHAIRGSVPVSSGYVDALGSVEAASTGSTYEQTQPPRAQVLSATRSGRVVQAQFALTGSVQSVARVVVKLDGRTVSTLRGGRNVFTVRVRARTGKRLAIEAFALDGRRLAGASARVRTLRSGKRSVGSGGGVGGSVWAD